MKKKRKKDIVIIIMKVKKICMNKVIHKMKIEMTIVKTNLKSSHLKCQMLTLREVLRTLRISIVQIVSIYTFIEFFLTTLLVKRVQNNEEFKVLN
jgi:hypothetical protein